MKKQPQKTTIQPKINANLPVQALDDQECSQIAGGSGVIVGTGVIIHYATKSKNSDSGVVSG